MVSRLLTRPNTGIAEPVTPLTRGDAPSSKVLAPRLTVLLPLTGRSSFGRNEKNSIRVLERRSASEDTRCHELEPNQSQLANEECQAVLVSQPVETGMAVEGVTREGMIEPNGGARAKRFFGGYIPSLDKESPEVDGSYHADFRSVGAVRVRRLDKHLFTSSGSRPETFI
jgi:hypothetical protein